MSSKNTTEVIIGGKVFTLGGYESEEYLQKIASYINNLKHELIAEQIKAEAADKQIEELKDKISKLQNNIVKLETELEDSRK